MSDNNEWSEWFEHDGKGCPLQRGTAGEAELRDERVVPFRALCGSSRGGPYVAAQNEAGSAWDWGNKPRRFFCDEVIRYRIRKPLGLTILQEIAADPQPVSPERIDA